MGLLLGPSAAEQLLEHPFVHNTGSPYCMVKEKRHICVTLQGSMFEINSGSWLLTSELCCFLLDTPSSIGTATVSPSLGFSIRHRRQEISREMEQ